MAINTNILKAYAPEARRAFIAAVKARAARFGITEAGSSPIREEGNVAIINDQPYPRSFAQQRRNLDQKIAIRGYASVMEEVAYTWFNRFAAIRYMELHDYLEHGVRVLSHPNGGSTPEIIEKAAQVELPGLKRDQVIALKIDGTKDDELYRMLIVAQCNALHAAMPFLFEEIDDETELLLPDNLLHSESLVRQLVERIPELDWQHIEIIGWLYQFYIAEKKDQVIGEVVKTEDIPAATQLFTPNWIVKYMVQNSLGAQWLATYPNSPLREKMEFYIAPSTQAHEVQAQIDAETPKALNPEELTFLDPASGSGHILVEAYNIFREIYLERGYRSREFPRLILEKNVFGLDIDDRAAQLSGFALLMRARADDRQILTSERPVNLNVLALQESKGIDSREVARAILPRTNRVDLLPTVDLLPDTVAEPTLAVLDTSTAGSRGIADLIALFANAKTLGSLISVPPTVAAVLPELRAALAVSKDRDLLTQATMSHWATIMMPLIQQAELLSRKYAAVAANPPYMGEKYFCDALATYAGRQYPDAKGDLYTCFVVRCLQFLLPAGIASNLNIPGWMMNSSFSSFRQNFLGASTLVSLIHNGRGVFGSDFGSCAFAFRLGSSPNYMAEYRRLFEDPATVASNSELSEAFHKVPRHLVAAADFSAIPGMPIAYWVSDKVRRCYQDFPRMDEFAVGCQGLSTSNDPNFVRFWYEVDISSTTIHSSEDETGKSVKWHPYNKGGDYRKWYGNQSHIINWQNNGADIKARKPKSVIRNESRYFRESVSWQDYTISSYSFRYYPSGFIFATNAHSAFVVDDIDPKLILALCNSSALMHVASAISPGLHFNSGYFNLVPAAFPHDRDAAIALSEEAIEISKFHWDAFETSWGFGQNPLLIEGIQQHTVEQSIENWIERRQADTSRLIDIEEQNNRLYLEAYGLEGEVDFQVEESAVSLGPDVGQEVPRLVSYFVGCLLGRYSLQMRGLMCAGEALQPGADAYGEFGVDDDGIVPITDEPWFMDDATQRFVDFVGQAWPRDTLHANLNFIAHKLGGKESENPVDAIRRYLSREFYKDHLRRYKKRPIYWLFSSGREKAFEALVYLHRYNEGTLARMRLEYVVPLQTQMAGRVQRLTDELQMGNLSSSETKKRNVQLEKLQKQQDELRRFEEELHHFADQRIKLDLDDGVKVNYGKFGNLLADVKTITGGKDD